MQYAILLFLLKKETFKEIIQKNFLKVGYTLFILKGKINKVEIELKKEYRRNLTHKWIQRSHLDSVNKLNFNLQSRKKKKVHSKIFILRSGLHQVTYSTYSLFVSVTSGTWLFLVQYFYNLACRCMLLFSLYTSIHNIRSNCQGRHTTSQIPSSSWQKRVFTSYLTRPKPGI